MGLNSECIEAGAALAAAPGAHTLAAAHKSPPIGTIGRLPLAGRDAAEIMLAHHFPPFYYMNACSRQALPPTRVATGHFASLFNSTQPNQRIVVLTNTSLSHLGNCGCENMLVHYCSHWVSKKKRTRHVSRSRSRTLSRLSIFLPPRVPSPPW